MAPSAPGGHVVACPVCGTEVASFVGSKHGLRILRCGSCTVQYSEHRPSLAELPERYGEHYFHGDPAGYPAYERDEPVHRERAHHYLRDLAAHHPRPGTLLDVGCATGFFLDEARRAGWQVRGVEVSDWAAGYGRHRLGLDISLGAFPTADLDGRQFSAVTFLNVFEQLPDPRAAEGVLRDLVAPGGILALETWDADALVVRLAGMRWHKYRPADTPIYLNRASLLRLFPAPHWTLVEYRARTKWIRLQHGLHALGITLGDKAPGHSNGARPAAGSLAERLTQVTVPYRLGDLVWAVLRREA
jgi:SAM-dependent methyltransferase